jgi:hypothetical protein
MYKVKITFVKQETTHTFEYKDFSDALNDYYYNCKHMGDHAGYVSGEWIVSLINTDNDIIKQLKLSSIL